MSVTLEAVRKMADILKKNGSTGFVAYVHPDLESDVRAFPDFIETFDVEEFGTCGDVRFVKTTNA